MECLRNPEIKADFLVYGMASFLCTAGMYFTCGEKGAIGGFLISLFFSGLSLWKECSRFRRIAKMGDEIDRILHGEEVSVMQDCAEGDMAILATQINKMVRRLRDQSGRLMEDKSLMADFMADISHQIKTPLTAAQLILSFLQEEDIEKARRISLSQELSGLVCRIEWLIYALLRMSRLDAGTVSFQKEVFSVSDLWGRAYHALAIPLELRRICFSSKGGEGISIFGDLAWIAEAIENILKNCMEHTPPGGAIFVEASDNPLYTTVKIEDTGSGIAKEDLPHIFERFYRGKNQDSQSVGIGLALSRQIISSQNGTIHAGNRENGDGAVFEVRFYKAVV